MMIGEEQRTQLANMLRNQPQYHPMAAGASAGDIMQNADTLRGSYDKLKAAGNGDAWEGVKNKFSGLFSEGGATPNG